MFLGTMSPSQGESASFCATGSTLNSLYRVERQADTWAIQMSRMTVIYAHAVKDQCAPAKSPMDMLK